MSKKKLSFVFFGSGPVAAESLKLLTQNFLIEAVITKPSTELEMKSVAPDTKIYCVKNKQELDDLFSHSNFKSSVAVLIDFGIIVSQKVIDFFPRGIINSHFSLLPELRGADPISFAILEGKIETGVSLMLLVEAMDEGPLINAKSTTITDTDTTPTLSTKLIQLSYRLLLEALPKYVDGSIKPVAQDAFIAHQNISPSYTRKLQKNDGIINWNKPAITIEREIRAFSNWPKSRTEIAGIECIVNKSEIINRVGTPGSLFIENKKLGVYCGTDALLINKLTPAGKKEMYSTAFLAGYRNRLNL